MRYLKATVLIATISAALTIILFAAGWISTTPDLVLREKVYQMSKPFIIPDGAQLGIVVLLAFGAAWTTVDITRPALKAVVAFAAILLLVTGSRTLGLYNVFYSPFPGAFAILISFLIGLGYGRSESGSRKKTIERLFSQRVSRSVFSRLINSSDSMEFPGTLQEGTVVVCEVRNHRELMTLLTPESYAAMTNLYLQVASDYLVEVGGYLDECTGESLRVVFGAPLADPKHASKACRAAIDLLSRLDNLNRECDSIWQRRFDFRLGINSGEMIGAAYGSSRLASFSVSGPAVEFARRLCAACSTYGCRILVGPETFEQTAEAFEARPIEVLKATGERRRVELYEILAPKHDLSPERERSRDHFWRGVIYFREKQWEKSAQEFSNARITGIPDAALDFYIQRVERIRRGEEDTAKDQMALFTAS
jgi:class 3 adenylate cyclase